MLTPALLIAVLFAALAGSKSWITILATGFAVNLIHRTIDKNK